MSRSTDWVERLRAQDLLPTVAEEWMLDDLSDGSPDWGRALRTTRRNHGQRYLRRLTSAWFDEEPSPTALERAKRERRDLLALDSQARRLDRIERAIEWYRSPLLVALLLTEVRERVPAEPRPAHDLAELAVAVARSGTASNAAGCLPLALAHAGNALRAVGELQAAAPRFREARRLLFVEVEVPAWVRAEIASLHGSLLKDQRQLEEAEHTLRHALEQFEAARDFEGCGRARLLLAAVYRLAGCPERAIGEVSRALVRGISTQKTSRLLLMALNNLTLYLLEAGKIGEAADLMSQISPLYHRAPDLRVRRRWINAKLLLAQDDPAASEREFRATIRSFIEQDNPFYAAFAALDLAELLVGQRRLGAVTAVTRVLPPLFRSQGVHREATAAVLLLHRAAAQQAVDRGLIARLRSFLERSASDPTARLSDHLPKRTRRS